MTNSKDPRRFVKCVSVLRKILPAMERLSACSHRLRHEIETEYVGRIDIEGRVGHRARAVRNLGDGRKRAQKV